MTPNTAKAFRDDALGTLDAVGIAEAIHKKEISAKEVVTAAIERCRAVEPQIAAVAEEDFGRAVGRAEAATPESPGAFHGVPTFIKDLVAVEGLSTRFGSRAFDRAQPAKKNGPIVAQMLDMGLVNLGTSTLPEFGFTPSTEFPDRSPTRNPWNLDHTAGGSSGGAAALVAAGVVPIAHGADGGGSIRIPAACCGLVGLKCSRGRLLQEAAVRMMPVNIVVDGVLTRSVRDTAQYFAEAEKRYYNPKVPRMGMVNRPVERPLRIGMLLQSPVGAEVDAASQRTFHDTVALLTSLGHELIPASIPADDQFKEDFCHLYATGGFIVDRIGRFAFGPNYDASALTDLTKGLSREFSARPGKTVGAMRRLRKSAVAYAKVFHDLDVILSPVVSKLPPPIGFLGMDLPYDILFPRVIDWACYTPYCNATGGPSLSLPLGHDDTTNLPVGMLFSAAHGQDKLLLELALQLESAKPWAML